MQHALSLRLNPPLRFVLPVLTFLALLTGLYLFLNARTGPPLPLHVQLEKTIGIDAPVEVYEAAVTYAVKNLATTLDIELENYDLSQADYEAIVTAAATKFGNCHQYRLYALAPRAYSCFTCVSRPSVMLQAGQTCGTQRTRYGSELPEPGLKYFIEFEGDIFEVLVAEYVKLLLFQYSKERQHILQNNNLPVMEMPLPPGNKILR